MKLTLLLLWLALPVAWAAWHYGPGQDALKLDRSDAALVSAKSALAADDPAAALTGYDEALAALPQSESAQARRLRLARCQTLVVAGQLPAARQELEVLLNELTADPGADKALLETCREELASAKYYMTWLMRLEGLPREEWEPEADSARQHFRLLAETSSSDRSRHQENLESAIRLARMDLNDLQALPLPSQCKNCKSGKCNAPPKKTQKKPEDSRKAGGGPPADGEGS